MRDTFTLWLLGYFDNHLRDGAVKRWMQLSASLIVMFAVIEGITWGLVSYDLLSNSLANANTFMVGFASLAIAFLTGTFALLLDRSIFMLDLGHRQLRLWQDEAVRHFKGEVKSPEPELSEKWQGRIMQELNSLWRKVLGVPLVADMLETLFSVVRLPVLVRMILISLTFVLSVISGYATFGAANIIQKQHAENLEKERASLLHQKASVDGKYERSLANAEAQCKRDGKNAQDELDGAGRRKQGPGPKWHILKNRENVSCAQRDELVAQIKEEKSNLEAAALKREKAVRELKTSGNIEDKELMEGYESAKISSEKNYASRFREAADQAAQSKLFIMPWSNEDWSTVKSPAQVIHFFYVLFFTGMLMVKLFQNVSVSAYYSEEVQNAWSNERVRRKSAIDGKEHSHTYNFSRWYYTVHYVEKLIEDYTRSSTLNKMRECIAIIQDAKETKLRAEFEKLEANWGTLRAEVEKIEADIGDHMSKKPPPDADLADYESHKIREIKLEADLVGLRTKLSNMEHELGIKSDKIEKLELAENKLDETRKFYSEQCIREKELNDEINAMNSNRLATQNRLDAEKKTRDEEAANIEAAKSHIQKLLDSRGGISDENHRKALNNEVSRLNAQLDIDVAVLKAHEKNMEDIQFELSDIDHRLKAANDDLERVKEILRHTGPTIDLINLH